MKPEAAAPPPEFNFVSVDFRDIPGQSALFDAFLYGSAGDTNSFWPNRDLPLTEFSASLLSGYETNRELLCDALVKENKGLGAGPLTLENIERLRRADCVAVLTGQQAGLFSGPAYTIYKALSTVKIAASLRENGVNAVPVFWIASEDHDFVEISVAYFRDRKRQLIDFRIPQVAAYKGFPVGTIPMGSEIRDVIDRLFAQIEKTPFTGPLRDLFSECYQEGTDLAAAFGRLMTTWLSEYGLIFVNPLNPSIRQLSAPMFRRGVNSIGGIRDGLGEANRGLAEGGFHTQVEVNEDYLPLFHISESGVRSPLRETGGQVSAKDGSLKCTIEELAGLVVARPDSFSPNALFRPVVQDFVFPTVCYVGGAAEIAYFAQNHVIYRALGRPVTPIRHRAAVTLLNARHGRTLKKYDLSFDDLWKGYEAAMQRAVSRYADQETIERLAQSKAAIERELGLLSKTMGQIDPGLSDNFEKRRRKIQWHIKAMESKFLRFEETRNQDLVRRLRDLFDSGFPKGAPQERTICFADHVNRYGPRLFEWIYANIDESGHRHRLGIL